MRLTRPTLVLAAVVSAVLVNLAIYAIGSALGATFRFPGPEGAVIPWFVVAAFSAVPLALALTAVALLAPRWPWIFTAALVAAPVLLAASIPLMPVPVGFDAATTVSLSLMHLALAPIAILAVLGLRRRGTQASGGASSRSTIGSSASA